MKSAIKRITLLSFLLSLLISSSAFAEMKTIIKEYTYQAGEADSEVSGRTTAMREVKRLLLEELGTYLESITEVKSFQLTQDRMTALTAGIVNPEVIDEKWSGETYWIKAKIVADSDDMIKSIDKLHKDRDKSGQMEDAKKKADVLLEQNKELRKELALAKGHAKQEAQKKYDHAIKELSVIEWFESGVSNFESGHYNNSIIDFNKAIELDPKYAAAYSNRGFAHSALEEYIEAIDDFSKAIELNPNDARAYANRGIRYGMLGKHPSAINDFNKAIELDPNNAMASYVNRGIGYVLLGKYSLAIDDFSKVIERDPNNATVHNSRGFARMKLGEYIEAIDDLNQAIELDPNDATAYVHRGIGYGMLRKHDLAIDDFNKAIELDPNNIGNYYNRACAYSITGNSKSAIQDLEKTIQAKPAYREMAKTDKDFDNIRNTPEFKKLIGN